MAEITKVRGESSRMMNPSFPGLTACLGASMGHDDSSHLKESKSKQGEIDP